MKVWFGADAGQKAQRAKSLGCCKHRFAYQRATHGVSHKDNILEVQPLDKIEDVLCANMWFLCDEGRWRGFAESGQLQSQHARMCSQVWGEVSKVPHAAGEAVNEDDRLTGAFFDITKLSIGDREVLSWGIGWVHDRVVALNDRVPQVVSVITAI